MVRWNGSASRPPNRKQKRVQHAQFPTLVPFFPLPDDAMALTEVCTVLRNSALLSLFLQRNTGLPSSLLASRLSPLASCFSSRHKANSRAVRDRTKPPLDTSPDLECFRNCLGSRNRSDFGLVCGEDLCCFQYLFPAREAHPVAQQGYSPPSLIRERCSTSSAPARIETSARD